jgi:hypothetical protein
MGEIKKRWAFMIGLVGLFKIEWRTPCHNLLAEFFNTWRVENKDTIYVWIGEKVVIVDKYVIIVVFKISNISWKEKKQVEKQTIEAMFQHITLPRVYINVKQWSVSIMKSPYDLHFPTFIQIVYKRDRVYYFNNINVISMMIEDQGKFVDWANTMSK